MSDVVSNNRTFSNVGGTVLEDDGSLTVTTDNLQVQQLVDLGPPPFPLQRNSLHLIHQTSFLFFKKKNFPFSLYGGKCLYISSNETPMQHRETIGFQQLSLDI